MHFETVIEAVILSLGCQWNAVEDGAWGWGPLKGLAVHIVGVWIEPSSQWRKPEGGGLTGVYVGGVVYPQRDNSGPGMGAASERYYGHNVIGCDQLWDHEVGVSYHDGAGGEALHISRDGELLARIRVLCTRLTGLAPP